MDLKGSKNESNNTDGIPPPNSKSNGEQGKVENTKKVEEGSSENCEGASQICKIEKTLLACIKVPKNGIVFSFSSIMLSTSIGSCYINLNLVCYFASTSKRPIVDLIVAIVTAR